VGGFQRLEAARGGRISGPQTGTLKKHGTNSANKPTTSIAGSSSRTAAADNNFVTASGTLTGYLGGATGAAVKSARTRWSAIVNEAPDIPLFIMVSLDLPMVIRLQAFNPRC